MFEAAPRTGEATGGAAQLDGAVTIIGALHAASVTLSGSGTVVQGAVLNEGAYAGPAVRDFRLDADVLAGLIAIARLQGHPRMVADVACQRSEAARLAQQDMEALRGFSTLAGTTRSFDAIESTSRVVDAGTAYRIGRQIDATTLSRAKAASIAVGWTDRSGSARQVALHSIIAGSDPAPSAALALAPR